MPWEAIFMELTHDDIIWIAKLMAEEIRSTISASSSGRWMTRKKAMSYLSIRSLNTFKKLEDEGVIQGSYLGKTGGKRYDRIQIDEYLLRNRYTS
jgi:hypothetical protein